MQNSVQATLRAQVNRLQEAENAVWSVLNPLSDKTLASITGDLLDKVGARIGEPRGGMLDPAYQAAIRIRVRVNRSRGKATDIFAVAMLASINSTPAYVEYYPASWQVTCQQLPGGYQVSLLLGRAKAAGTYGVLVYTPVGQQNGMMWGDSVSGVYANNQKWGDSIAGPGNVWMSGQVCPKPPGT